MSWYKHVTQFIFRGDRLETAVFILHSYIEAHEEAQVKILYYLGETEHADTPEEALVVKESQMNVSLAKEKLALLPREAIAFIHSKQAARVLLHTQEEMIEDLQSEGILQERDGTILLRILHADFAKLRESRGGFYGLCGNQNNPTLETPGLVRRNSFNMHVDDEAEHLPDGDISSLEGELAMPDRNRSLSLFERRPYEADIVLQRGDSNEPRS